MGTTKFWDHMQKVRMVNTSLLKTELRLITKCWSKKIIKKKPESAIKIFLPTEVDFEAELLIRLF